MSTTRSIPAVAILLGLAACSSADETVVRSQPYCPKPSIVSELQQTDRVATDGRIEWTARLGSLSSICDPLEFDYSVEMDVTVDLTTGPAFQGGAVNLAYFVAVATPSGEVIDKQTFPVVLEPGRNERRAMRRETLRQRLPVTSQGERTSWTVLIGFEPTAEQVRERTEAAPVGNAAAPDATGSGQ